MSEFQITDQDFHLKQRVLKETAAAAHLLLSHRICVPPFGNFEYHVFLESHGTRHCVWQIVDFNLPQKSRTSVRPIEDAAEILAGAIQDPTLVAGRLFSISGGVRSDILASEIINALIRARWPYEIVGQCLRDGLITRERWQAALDAFNAERTRHRGESGRRISEKPSAVINAAKLLGLHPELTG